MSARPRPETLPPEELDLLLSRHLDGDLSPDETAELERFLAASPEARRRLESLSAVVASLHAAPAPAASFALSTRIFAGVLEGSGAVSGLFHRFGIAPKYGYLFALMAAIALVAVGLLSKTSPPVQVAQAPSRDVVSVFIPSSPAAAGKAADKAERAAGAPAAPGGAAASSAPAALQVASNAAAEVAGNAASPNARRASESPARTAGALAEGAPEQQPIVADGTVGAGSALGRRDAPSESRGDARGELKSEAATLSKAKPSSVTSAEATREAAAAEFAPEAAAKSAAAPAAAAGPAAAPRMAAANAASPVPAPASTSPSIALVSPAGGPAAWKLAVVPGLATLRGPLTARYRLTVSSDGRVTVAKKLAASPDPLPPAAEALILGLRLERIAGIPESSEIEIRLTIP